MKNGIRVIDSHTRVRETGNKEWVASKYVDPKFKARAPKYLGFIEGGERFELDGEIIPKPKGKGVSISGKIRGGITATDEDPRMCWDPDVKLQQMDQEGIDTCVISGGMLGVSGLRVPDPKLSTALYRAYNDWISKDICGRDPKRIKALAPIGLQDPEAAAAELRRAVKELGLVAGVIPTNRWGVELSSLEFEPIWTEAERLDVPIVVHANPSTKWAAEDRFDDFLYTHMVSNPFEQMIVVMTMTTSGLFDRHPKLRVAFLDAGAGYMPAWLDRLDQHFEKMPGRVKWQHSATDYLKRGQMYICVDPDERTLGYFVDFLGEDCGLYGSDWCGSRFWSWDSLFPHSADAILDNTSLSKSAKAKLLGQNAARLFKL